MSSIFSLEFLLLWLIEHEFSTSLGFEAVVVLLISQRGQLDMNLLGSLSGITAM